MAVAVAMPAWSGQRDKRAMRKAAIGALMTHGHRLSAANGIQVLRSSAAYSIYGDPMGGGFAMIAADDRLPAVLAVSDTPLESRRGANPGFEWYCASIEEVSRLLMQQDKAFTTTLPDPSKYPSHVEALIKTRWGQDAPFSNWCPTADGEICSDYRPDEAHCAVGCVATALAQIAYYYRYPAHAAATCDFMIGNQGATANFDATYDWDNMLEDYEGEYTEIQGRAVALLSYHCGLISQMTYGADESGSSNISALYGAQQILGYSKDAHIVARNQYDEPSWMDMVYQELSQGHPLYYQGVHMNFNPNQGGLGVAGHSFIIDGYDEQGLVHVNWGWYGNHDGYYDIALLDVRGLQFNAYQDMVLGFVPGMQQFIAGDVNGDGIISIDDVAALIDLLLGNGESTPGSDVDGDGNVSIDDVAALIDQLLHGPNT
ncbi:MAG: C10 family peptidase [Muribaculaceae bacterium]|nr:C10 family peptidase [Muribaculaceae bacterium]